MKCIAKHEGKVTVKSISREHEVTMDLSAPVGENKGMTPGEMLLSSVAGCKIISFNTVARMNKVSFTDLSIEIEAEAEEAGFLEGTKIPRKEIKALHTIYKLKSQNTREEIEVCVELVDKLCTVGNALSEKIKNTHDIILVD